MHVREAACRHSVVMNISTDNDQASFICKVLFSTLYKTLVYRSSFWKQTRDFVTSHTGQEAGMWRAHAASLGLPWFLCACWVNEDTAAAVCVANFSVSCAGTPEKSLYMMMASPSFIGLKENGIFTHWQRKDHLGTWLPVGSCPTLPALLQCYCLPLTSLRSSTTASAESQQCSGAPCLAKPSVSPSAHTTQPTCTSHMTFGNTFHFLLCFLFALTRWKGVWDLCEMIDCLAGETGQLSGELLPQLVTTQISSSPSVSQNLQKPKPRRYLLSVKSSDQHIQELCGWQTTEMHTHTNSECAHYEWCKCRIYRQ